MLSRSSLTVAVVVVLAAAACTDSSSSTTVPPVVGCGDGILDAGELCDGECPTTCSDGTACTAERLEGSTESCDARCVFATIATCTDGDGCCADGCTALSDSDCSPTCGNGTLELGEVCDGDCPTSCHDGNACTSDVLVGSSSSCSAACSFQAITACINGDGCCAPGCTANTDSDCSPSCGNGVQEAGEVCDGASCPTSCGQPSACVIASLVGAASSCSAACTYQAITQCQPSDGCCPVGCNANTDNDCSPTCGNSVLEGAETCDSYCPTSCNDHNACTIDVLSGSWTSCSAQCVAQPITQCSLVSDGCCPDGCTSMTDGDCAPSCPYWTREVADSAGETGWQPSLGVDSNGIVYIAHWDYGARVLRLSTRGSNGVWSSMTLDSSYDSGHYSSVAIDAVNNINIAYYDQGTRHVKHARKPVGGGWSTTTPTLGDNQGWSTSLGIQANGVQHVSYFEWYDEYSGVTLYTGDLAVGHRSITGEWIEELVDTGLATSVGQETTLAVTSDGKLYVAYRDDTNTALKLAVRPVGGAWSVTTLDNDGDIGYDPQIAVDPQGGVHLLYSAAVGDPNTPLFYWMTKYAYLAPGSSTWSFAAIAEVSGGHYNAITTDAQGGVHITYVSDGPGVTNELHYGYRPAGGTWTMDTIDSTDNIYGAGGGTSIVVDAAGGVHIAFGDVYPGYDVTYLYRCPP